MSYISKEEVSKIRENLKKEFPEIKFSVVRKDFSCLDISIMKSPYKFVEENYKQLNYFYPESYQNSDILKRIIEIANKNNYDRSDAMSDYFDVGYYFHLSVGKWDKPFELVEPKAKASKAKATILKVESKPIKKSFFSKVIQAVRVF